MLQFNGQQQQQGIFPALKELEERVPPWFRLVTSTAGAVGGYLWGVAHGWPPILTSVFGLVTGLLFVTLMVLAICAIAGALVIALVATVTFYMGEGDMPKGKALSAPAYQGAAQPDEKSPLVRTVDRVLQGVQR